MFDPYRIGVPTTLHRSAVADFDLCCLFHPLLPPAQGKKKARQRNKVRARAAAAGLTAESSPLDFLRATGYDVDGMASALRDAHRSRDSYV